MSIAVMGIDPSLTGFCSALAVEGQPVRVVRSTSKSLGKNPQPWSRLRRYHGLVCDTCVLAQQWVPRLVLVEGPSFASVIRSNDGDARPLPQRGHHDRAELRAVLYMELSGWVGDLVEVAPTTVKLFAAGKGNASKGAVKKGVAALYGRSFDTDDEADAYALTMLALAVAGHGVARTRAQLKAVDTVRSLLAAQKAAA